MVSLWADQETRNSIPLYLFRSTVRQVLEPGSLALSCKQLPLSCFIQGFFLPGGPLMHASWCGKHSTVSAIRNRQEHSGCHPNCSSEQPGDLCKPSAQAISQQLDQYLQGVRLLRFGRTAQVERTADPYPWHLKARSKSSKHPALLGTPSPHTGAGEGNLIL